MFSGRSGPEGAREEAQNRPAHLSVCGHRSFHGSAWTSESARIHPQNQISSLSFSVCGLCFGGAILRQRTTWCARPNCRFRTVVILFLSDAVRGLRFFREKMAKTKSSYASFVFYIQIQIYSAFLHVSPVEEDVTWHYVLYTKTNIFNVGYFLRWIN